MRTLQNPITCNDTDLARSTKVPENALEIFIGLRGKKIEFLTSMLFILSRTKNIYEVFDTFLCGPMGYVATDCNGVVLKVGVMKPNKMLGIKCAYWLEVSPERVYGVSIGDRIEGLN